ncbi:variable large family protein [Borreliella burgdorferi]|uniref:variable large family protein n=1 Tax=Borreliella burgdorferi TaxID=139 RepID=UPI003A1008D8
MRLLLGMAAGGAGANFGNDMKKKDKVAAALVLRGLAKGGKFSTANANDANVKSAVENAVGKKEDVLKDVKADAGAADQETGKLFGTAAGGNDAGADDNKKAAEAVSSVSGEQILKAIVDAAGGGEQNGQAPNVARNPIAAAIGAAAGGNGADFGDNDMKKKDKVAAALVLRGLAKGGKFSAANDNGANVKSAVENAVGKKDGALKDVQAAGDAGDAAEAGKLFGTARGGAAGKEGEQNGKAPGAAKNPIAAAIGAAAGNGFGNDMKKKDKVAAALVLRGLAKDGKFSAADGGGYGMIKAAEEAIGGATGDGKIGESVANGAAADANSVKNIAKGMKGIVDAAGTAAGKKEDALKDVQVAGDAAEAGKLFGAGGAGANASADDIKKAAAAVSSVSGEQILKAIVDAAGGGEQEGQAPNAAKNPIAAAIGNGAAGGAGANFGNDMKKKDKVAAALVLRGLAKGGKFSTANANDANVKSAVENAVGKKEDVLKDVKADAGAADQETGKLFGTAAGGNDAGADDNKKAAEAVSSVSGEQILKAIVDAAGGGEQNGQAPNVARNPIAAAIGAAAGGSGADFGDNDMKKKDKVAAALVLRGLAKGGKFSAANDNGANVKSAVENAVGKKDGALKDVQAAGDAGDAAEAGKLFGTARGGAAGEKGEQDGKAPNAAKNPIAAAIGAAAGNGFGNDMKKKDKVAAALVLRGLAKDGKFSAADGGDYGMIKAAEEAIGGATGDGKIGESVANGAAADANSVKNIAKGMKGIVDAAGTAAGKKDDALKDVQDAGAADAAAGKLFGAGGGNAGAADIKKAAEAVSSVSGEQILKAIVDAAGGGEQNGAAPGDAKNPIAAAIGAGAGAGADMRKKDKVAAALVLRGLAKGGKFSAANADGANVKSAVENAVGKKDGVLKDVQAAAGDAAEAGKLFGTTRGGAAGEKGGEQEGKAPGAARNPIAAAIGNGAGDNFGVADMKKKDKVAAALVLRGLAKNGKFSAADGGDYGMIKAAEEAIGGAATGGDGKIGESAANGAAAEADSVKNIAKGMKGIVDAAGTAAGKKEDALKDVKAAGDAAEAGKLFGAGGAGADADADIKKAAAAVSSVSGEQILKAIVDAAGEKGGEQEGKAPNVAKNPIAAAIGAGAGRLVKR